MVATIVLPVLAAVGVGPMTSVGIFLFGISIGGTLNVGNWALYKDVLLLNIDQIRPFALFIFALLFALALVYITLQLYFDGHDLNLKKLALNASSALLVIGGGIVSWFYLIPADMQAQALQLWAMGWKGLQWFVGAGLCALTLSVLARAWQHRSAESVEVHWSAYFSPIVPLLLILVYGADFIAAFLAGLLYAFASTYRRGRLNTLTQACLEGAAVVMPAVIL